MDIDDDTLMAFADGEIDGDEAARLRAQIAADPALADRFALFTHSADWMKAASLANPDATVSPGLEARIREMAATTSLEAENVVPMRRPEPRWRSMALAASLALAVGLSAGLLLAPGAPEMGAPLLSAAVQERLGTLPSGAEDRLPDGRRVSAVASFTDSAGAFCREYETSAQGGDSHVAVACRNGDDWSLRFAIASVPGNDGYAPASSLEALDAFYAAIGASQPLSGDAELEHLK